MPMELKHLSTQTAYSYCPYRLKCLSAKHKHWQVEVCGPPKNKWNNKIPTGEFAESIIYAYQSPLAFLVNHGTHLQGKEDAISKSNWDTLSSRLLEFNLELRTAKFTSCLVLQDALQFSGKGLVDECAWVAQFLPNPVLHGTLANSTRQGFSTLFSLPLKIHSMHVLALKHPHVDHWSFYALFCLFLIVSLPNVLHSSSVLALGACSSPGHDFCGHSCPPPLLFFMLAIWHSNNSIRIWNGQGIMGF